MGDRVQSILQTLIIQIKDQVEQGIFTKVQGRKIIKSRREHQYNMQRPAANIDDFLKSLIFQYKLEKIRTKRAKIQTSSLKAVDKKANHYIIKRILNVFDRAIVKFNAVINIWKLYIKFLIENQCRKKLQTVLSRAFRLHPNVKDFWIITAFTILQNSKDAQKGRAIFQKGLKGQTNDPDFWGEYLRYEIQASRILYQWEVVLYRKKLKSKGQDNFDFIDQQLGQEEEKQENDDQDEAIIKPSFDNTIIRTVMQNAFVLVQQKKFYQLVWVIWMILWDDDYVNELRDVMGTIQRDYIQTLRANVMNYSYFLLCRIKEDCEGKVLGQSEVEEILDQLNQMIEQIYSDSAISLQFVNIVNICRKKDYYTDKMNELFCNFLSLPKALIQAAKYSQQSMQFLSEIFHCLKNLPQLQKSMQICDTLLKYQPNSSQLLINYSYLQQESNKSHQNAEKIIQNLQQFLQSNNLMSSRCQKSLRVRIRILQIISTYYPQSSLITSFILIAPLYSTDQKKLRSLQNNLCKFLSIQAPNQYSKLYEFYTQHKIPPSLSLINMISQFMPQEDRKKWEKLIDKKNKH